MKVRRGKEPTRVGSPEVKAVPFTGAARLVTLDSPGEGPEAARGAFARLRAPEGLSGPETASWRSQVAAIAIAVRVVPPPRAAAVPADSARVTGEAVGGIREEAMLLAAETGDPELVALVERILVEVEAG